MTRFFAILDAYYCGEITEAEWREFILSDPAFTKWLSE